MSTDLIEQKLADLQHRVERLEARDPEARKDGSWRDAIGFAEGDELFREAMEIGGKLRDLANREGR